MLKFTVEELLLDESFINYCRGNDPIHTAKWEALLEEHPGQQKTMAEARELLFLLSPELPKEEIVKEVEKLRKLIGEPREQRHFQPGNTFSVTANGTLRHRRIRRFAMYAVAAALITFGTFQLVNRSFSKNSIGTIAASYRSGPGERKSLTLPDGSTVILNSNSSISIDNDFGGKQRRVQLAGEAFFQVAKDKTQPFIVSSDRFSTTAIGTAFYVNGRHSAAVYKVTLLEGKVRLGDGSPASSFLDPGQEASWTAGSGHFIKNNFDTLSLKQWLNGRISFNKTPVAKAFSTLQRWYGMDIEDLRQDRTDVSLNGDYTNQSLEDILKVVCFSLSCHYTISGNKITIR